MKVKRTGKPPLQFDGELLADCNSKIVSGRERNRWFSIAVYGIPASDEDVVVAITYFTQWQGELEFSWAEQCPFESVYEAIRDFEAEFGNHWRDLRPSSDDLREEWGREWLALRNDLRHLCSDICETCGVVQNLDTPDDIETEHDG